MTDADVTWKDIILSNGLAIQDENFEQLCAYRDLLVEWNSKVNLVSRKDTSNIWPNHILHSVSLLFILGFPTGILVADIGSGGGLPGIPLAICLPGVEFVLIESIKKKCVALLDMVSRLGLKNVQVANGRAEELSGSVKYRSRFDLVIVRAVGPLADLAGLSVPLVGTKRRTGQLEISGSTPASLPCLVAMKGGDIEVEIAETKRVKRVSAARSFPLQFKGMEKTGLSDKKVIIIGLS